MVTIGVGVGTAGVDTVDGMADNTDRQWGELEIKFFKGKARVVRLDDDGFSQLWVTAITFAAMVTAVATPREGVGQMLRIGIAVDRASRYMASLFDEVAQPMVARAWVGGKIDPTPTVRCLVGGKAVRG